MSDKDDSPKPLDPLDYRRPDPSDTKETQRQEREREAHRRRYLWESRWEDAKSNWRAWIVVIVAAILFYGCLGRGGCVWMLIDHSMH